MLVYLNARDTYRLEREEKTGKGFVDFIFHPLRPESPAIILELKKGQFSREGTGANTGKGRYAESKWL